MKGRGFEATDRLDRLDEPDFILICVPTPLSETREHDLAYVVNSARAIAARLRAGQLVILESTTYPTTTCYVVLPIVEDWELEMGRDVFLAFSPEREDPGNPEFTASTFPKVVGGLDPISLQLAASLYGQAISQVVRASSPEVAESCKILENTYRPVNITLGVALAKGGASAVAARVVLDSERDLGRNCLDWRRRLDSNASRDHPTS